MINYKYRNIWKVTHATLNAAPAKTCMKKMWCGALTQLSLQNIT